MRILALDWGTVRIGGAVSDPEGKIAFPLQDFIESKNSIAEIKKLVFELGVEKILLGIPKNLSGQDSNSTKLASEFAEKLQSQIALPLEFMDERLSSIGAGKTLSDSGFSKKQQREMVDNLAAAQMLQSYLDQRN